MFYSPVVSHHLYIKNKKAFFNAFVSIQQCFIDSFILNKRLSYKIRTATLTIKIDTHLMRKSTKQTAQRKHETILVFTPAHSCFVPKKTRKTSFQTKTITQTPLV